jgi:hypothetical protein
VPACWNCNNGASKDDEKFRNLCVTFGLGHSKSALDIWEGPIKSSIKHPGSKALLQRLHSNMKLVDRVTPGGIYLGTQDTEWRITEADWEVLHGVSNRVGLGLYWHLFGSRPGADMEVKTKSLSYDVLQGLVNDLGSNLSVVKPSETGETFSYGFARVEQGSAIIITSYYDKYTAGTFVAPQGVLVDNPNPKKAVLDLRT